MLRKRSTACKTNGPELPWFLVNKLDYEIIIISYVPHILCNLLQYHHRKHLYVGLHCWTQSLPMKKGWSINNERKCVKSTMLVLCSKFRWKTMKVSFEWFEVQRGHWDLLCFEHFLRLFASFYLLWLHNFSPFFFS